MTDAFLPLCIVAAMAEGTTIIRGIANQKVKECDRLAAMSTELSKVGISAVETGDGLIITGRPLEDVISHVSASGGVSIDCYNDHRVAMSFAVLGAVCPGITIADQRCVEKTYPEFWDDLHRIFDLDVVGVSCPSPPSHLPLDRSVQMVVVIGMRGCGKSFLSRSSATSFGWPCVDLDEVVEKKVGCRCDVRVSCHDDILAPCLVSSC